MVASVNRNNKTVASPNAEYESMLPLWEKARAVCAGERFVKEYDRGLDTVTYKNLLIPFSPSMTPDQYNFYKAEAELPGITAQFARMLVGALLRKKPILNFTKDGFEDIKNWLLNNFGQDGGTLSAFLDSALFEEVQTSRAWVYVDFPKIDEESPDVLEIAKAALPYPVLWKAEDVVNWRVKTLPTGQRLLDRVIVRDFVEDFSVNEFHPELVERVKVHELNESGHYQIRVYKAVSATTAEVINGKRQYQTKQQPAFELEDVVEFKIHGKPLEYIPAWPLNGSVDCQEPVLMPVIDKEVNLYNKLSRRNHLLYGASTYTPWIASDMMDEEFDDIVSQGLGTWLRLRQGDEIGVLETPTAALADMDRAITASIEEMAKLGIRMLSPESAQSGVALEIRNAAQTAQLGTLNTKVSDTIKQVMLFMIRWKFPIDISDDELNFTMSDDFGPTPLGADWLRLATEWYQSGLIPRSAWLNLLKSNDLLEADYSDEEAQKEIAGDENIITKGDEDSDIKD